MGVLPAGERHVGRGHVGNLGLEKKTAHGRDPVRFHTDQRQDHGNVMGREAPEYILLAPHLAQVQAMGIDVAQAPQVAPGNQFLQPYECRVVLQQVAHHQHPSLLSGQGIQFFGGIHVQGDGFFDKHVLPCRQRLPGEVRMGHRRRGDGDRVDSGVTEDFLECRGGDPVLPTELPGRFRVRIADRGQRAQVGEIAHQVPAPVTAADDRYARRRLSCRTHQ